MEHDDSSDWTYLAPIPEDPRAVTYNPSGPPLPDLYNGELAIPL